MHTCLLRATIGNGNGNGSTARAKFVHNVVRTHFTATPGTISYSGNLPCFIPSRALASEPHEGEGRGSARLASVTGPTGADEFDLVFIAGKSCDNLSLVVKNTCEAGGLGRQGIPTFSGSIVRDESQVFGPSRCTILEDLSGLVCMRLFYAKIFVRLL